MFKYSKAESSCRVYSNDIVIQIFTASVLAHILRYKFTCVIARDVKQFNYIAGICDLD